MSEEVQYGGECKLCDSPTNQVFNVMFFRVFICEPCEFRIVKQSIDYRYTKRKEEDL